MKKTLSLVLALVMLVAVALTACTPASPAASGANLEDGEKTVDKIVLATGGPTGTYYAYTNKRVIIRKGIFGVDYKSLDMSMIGAVDVSVTLLDKIVHKNTGTIAFGSMANPMGNQNGFMFKFAHVYNPYETYKEIKTVIDEFKNKKKD